MAEQSLGAAAIAACVVFAGAIMTITSPASSAQTAAQFRNQLQADWEYWVAQYPEFATQLGRTEHDDRWTDYSAAALEGRAQYLRESLKRITGFDKSALPSGDRVSYDLYRDLLEVAVEGLALHYDALPIRSVVPGHLLMPINQLGGVQQDVARIVSLMRIETLKDYENLIARLERVPALVDQTIALMERGLAEGITQPKVVMRGVPPQLAAQIVSDPLDSPLLEGFKRFPAGIGSADRDRLTTAARRAYTNNVVPAFRKLQEFVEQVYLPKCRDEIPIAAIPNGSGLYRYNVAWHTTTTQTPDEIHQIGLTEVERIRAEMDKVIASSGFKGTFPEFLTFLRTDPRFYFTRAEDMLVAYRDIAKRADPELARLFGTLPRLPYGVRAIPDAVAPSQTTAYYEPGSPAAGRAANMFVNTYKLDARPRWEMEALTLHEAVPGHHLQIALAQELTDVPEFRKHNSYTAYVEGWALYSELLGHEMGFYADPYSHFGQLTYQMWRAIRLVVDTGMHAKGWSRQQAIDYFRENSAKAEQDIVVEIDRYIAWPGQAIGYKIGELKISELRAKAEKALGPRFDLRSFHDLIHAEGAVPLALLEEKVDGWIQARS